MAADTKPFSQVQCLIFDLDGTLIDSRLDLAHAVNATLAHMDRPPLPHETIFRYVGNGAQALIQRALGREATPLEAETGLAYFLSYYREHMLDNTVTYPGVREGLKLLGDRRMAVLTNKPVRFSLDSRRAWVCPLTSNTCMAATASRKRSPTLTGSKCCCAISRLRRRKQ